VRLATQGTPLFSRRREIAVRRYLSERSGSLSDSNCGSLQPCLV